MDKNAIITRLLELPGEIKDAEDKVIEAVDILQGQKSKLTEKQDTLLLSGSIDGKNAEIRNAQLRAQTTDEQFSVRQAENALSVEKATLNSLLNEQGNLRAIAGLLKGAE